MKTFITSTDRSFFNLTEWNKYNCLFRYFLYRKCLRDTYKPKPGLYLERMVITFLGFVALPFPE
ncbi:MAG: hypothetical protein ACXVNO_01195 [Bacteroidia bacterium]